MINSDRASGRTSRAYRISRVKKPNSALETKISGGQRSDGTNIDYIPGVGIIEGAIFKSADRYMIASSKKLHLAGLSYVLEEPYTSRTQDTSLLVQYDHRS